MGKDYFSIKENSKLYYGKHYIDIDNLKGMFSDSIHTEIIFGPPGCGKTTTLLNILEKELHRVKANEIAFVSFTNKGVKEGRERAKKRFKLSNEKLQYFRTLHSLGFYLSDFTKDDLFIHQYKLLRSLGLNTYLDSDAFGGGQNLYENLNFLYMNNITEFSLVPEGSYDKELFKFYRSELTKFKLENKKFDYNDMLMYPLYFNLHANVKVAIIDEAQDLTRLQWLAAFTIFSKCQRLYIAGDDDQAIFEWSGADIETFLNINGERRILSKSYRLLSNIHRLSQDLVEFIEPRVDKKFTSLSSGGEIFIAFSRDEIDLTMKGSYLLLARNNTLLKFYTQYLMQNTLPFKLKGVKSVSSKRINAIRAFKKKKSGETLHHNDEITLMSNFQDLNMHMPWWMHEEFFDEEKDHYEYSYEEYIADALPPEEMYDKYNVNTIHGVKGGEADNVIVLLDHTRQIEKNKNVNLNSELRVLYVAITRARKRLILFAGPTREKTYGGGSYIEQLKRLTGLRDFFIGM